jgi:hypothetical protein
MLFLEDYIEAKETPLAIYRPVIADVRRADESKFEERDSKPELFRWMDKFSFLPTYTRQVAGTVDSNSIYCWWTPYDRRLLAHKHHAHVFALDDLQEMMAYDPKHREMRLAFQENQVEVLTSKKPRHDLRRF